MSGELKRSSPQTGYNLLEEKSPISGFCDSPTQLKAEPDMKCMIKSQKLGFPKGYVSF